MHQADNGSKESQNTVVFSEDAVAGRENEMDVPYHLHSVILSLRTLSQCQKLVVEICPCCVPSHPDCRGFRGTGVEA